jgi:uncharacterized protein HemX
MLSTLRNSPLHQARRWQSTTSTQAEATAARNTVRQKPSRLYRTSRAIAVVAGLGVVGWQVDVNYNAAAITRSARALTMG